MANVYMCIRVDIYSYIKDSRQKKINRRQLAEGRHTERSGSRRAGGVGTLEDPKTLELIRW